MQKDMLNDKNFGYHDKQGNKISLNEWHKLIEDKDYSKVKQETIGDHFISTVLLGLNHSHGDGILIFETMIFTDYERGYEIYCDRYETLKQAEKGHLKALEWLKDN